MPTWDYVSVNVTGRAKVVNESEEKIAFLQKLTKQNETDRLQVETGSAEWGLEYLTVERLHNMLKGISFFTDNI